MAVSTAAMPPSTRAEPKSSHVSDTNIQPFLYQDFDPAEYLNNTLPALSLSTTARGTQTGQYGRSIPLPELSSQLQNLLSQLNAQTSRLSNALTQLTDEIIRSGGRLAYEVEVLRGETIGLTDSLDNGLRKDIELFTPSSKELLSTGATIISESAAKDDRTDAARNSTEPEHLERLRTLTAVRSRLDSVIKVFGEAMQWPIAPSEISLTSSLISVSAPDATDDFRSREEKGKAHAERLRNEINDLIGSKDNATSLQEATARIEDLRRLAEVWKGTAEEKARLKMVESLSKPVEEQLKALEQTVGARRPAQAPPRGMDYRYGNMDSSRTVSEGGYGFLQNLRNLRSDVYLE